MAKSGIAHADVGDELSKAEWLDEENHELIHGNGFPGSPTERQLFYRDDEHEWYIYNGTSWVSLQAAGGTPDHLDDIGDLNVPTPSDDDVLYWDNAASQWKCKANWTAAHKTSHENGGSDEISLAGLSGDPADTINKSLLTTAGDIIKRGASAPERLAIGSNDQVLTVVSGAPAWAAPSGGGGTKIQDADADTKVDTEESADEDTVRMDVAGNEAFKLSTAGILTLARQSTVGVYRNSNQTIANETWTKILFDTELWDYQNEFASNKFTATEAGIYLVSLGFTFADTQVVANKLFGGMIRVNGSGKATHYAHSALASWLALQCVGLVQLSASDYVEGFVYQATGASKDLLGGAQYTNLFVAKVA